MKIEESFYNEEELQELSDSEDISMIPVTIVNEFTGEEEKVNCLVESDVITFYEDEFTDHEYHQAVLYEDSDIVEDLTTGTTITILFDSHGTAICAND